MLKHIIFFGTILTFMGVVLFSVWQQESIIRTGELVILETEPIDPRDLFRGEYVILRYKIENDALVRQTLAGATTTKSLYVRLETDDRNVAYVAAVSLTPPDWESGLWLTGTVRQPGEVRFPMLEQYYVPEGAGLPIERMGSDVHVVVAIKQGEGRIVELLDADLAPINPPDLRPEQFR